MTRLDECSVYVFIRQDIPLPTQLVHACHAAFQIALRMTPEAGIPNMILIGVPHPAALARAQRRLDEKAIPAHVFEDTDYKFGPTAIATYPLSKDARKELSNYRLWVYSPSIPQGFVPSMAKGEPSRRSSEKEHSVFNREVVGSIPADGSKVSGFAPHVKGNTP